MAVIAGHQQRVYIDGRDISRYVRRMTISSTPTTLQTITLELVGELRVEGPDTFIGFPNRAVTEPAVPQVPDHTTRAITVTT